MIHIWHWLLNFTGVNDGQNHFGTQMYNFWSGFGADITEFALVGTIIGIYRHHLKQINLRHLVHLKKRANEEDKHES